MELPVFSYAGQGLGDVLADLAVRFVLNCPPEDVSAPERLGFQIEEAHWFYEDFARVDNASLPGFRIKAFVEGLYQACPVLKELNSDPVGALNALQSYKSLIPVRGAIILNETMDKCLMVRGWKGSSWGFPRGKINKDEKDEDCAVREVKEETGFDIGSRLVAEDFLEVVRNGKSFRLYVIQGVPESTVFETQTRKEISKIEWYPLNQLPGWSRKSGQYNTHFYMATPFVQGLKKFVGRLRGAPVPLSTLESDALKNILGVTPGQAVRSDEKGAKQLLDLLHTPSAMSVEAQDSTDDLTKPKSDRQVLLDLLKTGRDSKLESAQQILGMLKGEIANEQAGQEQVTALQPVVLSQQSSSPRVDASKAPTLPPDSTLSSLISSRRSARQSESLLGFLKPKPSAAQGLLGLLEPSSSRKAPTAASLPTPRLNSSASASLLGLLKPSTPDEKICEKADPVSDAVVERTSASSSLLDLLGPSKAQSEKWSGEQETEMIPGTSEKQLEIMAPSLIGISQQPSDTDTHSRAEPVLETKSKEEDSTVNSASLSLLGLLKKASPVIEQSPERDSSSASTSLLNTLKRGSNDKNQSAIGATGQTDSSSLSLSHLQTNDIHSGGSHSSASSSLMGALGKSTYQVSAAPDSLLSSQHQVNHSVTTIGELPTSDASAGKEVAYDQKSAISARKSLLNLLDGPGSSEEKQSHPVLNYDHQTQKVDDTIPESISSSGVKRSQGNDDMDAYSDSNDRPTLEVKKESRPANKPSALAQVRSDENDKGSISLLKLISENEPKSKQSLGGVETNVSEEISIPNKERVSDVKSKRNSRRNRKASPLNNVGSSAGREPKSPMPTKTDYSVIVSDSATALVGVEMDL